MRNPFIVLKSAVLSLFKGRNPAPPVYSLKPQPAQGIVDLDDEDRAVINTFRKMGKTPISREEPRAHAPKPVQDIPWGPESRRKARNQHRKARAEVRAFVLKLNRARG